MGRFDPGGRKEETRKVLKVQRGWLMRSENNIFGGSTYYFQKGDSAWLCQNLWDHYAFTQDKEYLKRYAYPIMKEISEFWVDHLKALADGTLVAPDGRSPEHGPAKSDGVSYDQQLCWDLFTNTIEAGESLGIDADYRAELIAKRARLLGQKVGKWGQLQEWMEDIDDPKDQHRHISHLIAVFPGRQIHPTTTPKLAEAAKVSMIARGTGGTGWSMAIRACVYARLLDAERAYAMLSTLMATKVQGNLWTTHPPFQIDANFGYAAGVNEMLAQSHLGIIHLLPGLPKAWPAGYIKGLRMRGGYEVDIEWKNGDLTRAVVRGVSNDVRPCVVRYGKGSSNFTLARGESACLRRGFRTGTMKERRHSSAALAQTLLEQAEARMPMMTTQFNRSLLLVALLVGGGVSASAMAREDFYAYYTHAAALRCGVRRQVLGPDRRAGERPPVGIYPRNRLSPGVADAQRGSERDGPVSRQGPRPTFLLQLRSPA